MNTAVQLLAKKLREYTASRAADRQHAGEEIAETILQGALVMDVDQPTGELVVDHTLEPSSVLQPKPTSSLPAGLKPIMMAGKGEWRNLAGTEPAFPDKPGRPVGGRHYI